MSSKVTGRIVDVLVEEGMTVTEGSVLARLDNTTERSYLALAEVQFGRRGAPWPSSMCATRTSVSTSIASAGCWTSAGSDRRISTWRRPRRTRSGRGSPTSASSWSWPSARSTCDGPALEDTVIRAPFSGVAVSTDAQSGGMISPVSAGGGFIRTGVCTIVDTSSLQIEVDVNGSYINGVSLAQRMVATLDAYADWEIRSDCMSR